MAVLDILKRKPEEPEPSVPNIPPLPLRQLIDGERRLYLLKLLSHLRGTQHAHKRYDWDARLLFGDDSLLDIPVDNYVPMKRRRPCISLRMAKVITKRLTTMVFGHDRFPTLCVEGDEDAEDFVRELARMAKLRTKMVEARDKGGACGTVILSWGFEAGKPVVDVHAAPFVEVLEWEDYENRVPLKVIKVYEFQKRVLQDGKLKTKTFWNVRYWDDQVEQTWEPIPDDVANTRTWISWPSTTVFHALGKCPVIWVQNMPNSDDIDGIPDADGQHEDFDEMDRLASATNRGTVGNVDPTLVIQDKKGKDESVVRKGSGVVIYSPGGASYLELAGSAVDAAKTWLNTVKQTELDEAEVVLLDPEKLSGAGVSAASLKVRFAPMLAKCDLIRDQYAEAITSILRCMLDTARKLDSVVNEEGQEVWSMVEMEPKLETHKEVNEDGEEVKVQRLVERHPGSSSHLSLKWPPYFPATWEDRRAGVQTAKEATGGAQVLSERSAVELLAPMLDIPDVDAELERIEEDQESKDARAQAMFGPEPMPRVQGDDDDDPDEDKDDPPKPSN